MFLLKFHWLYFLRLLVRHLFFLSFSFLLSYIWHFFFLSFEFLNSVPAQVPLVVLFTSSGVAFLLSFLCISSFRFLHFFFLSFAFLNSVPAQVALVVLFTSSGAAAAGADDMYIIFLIMSPAPSTYLPPHNIPDNIRDNKYS